MLVVPLIAVPSQTLSVQLSNQNCFLKVYQKSAGLFMDVYVDDELIIGGVICEHANRIVRSIYLGFTGDFVFWDTEGNAEVPEYSTLGSQFILVYLDPTDLAVGGVD